MTYKGESKSDNQLNKLLEVDAHLDEFDRSSSGIEGLRLLRSAVKELICGESNRIIDSSKSFSKVLKIVKDDHTARRFAALLVLRLLNVQGFFPSNNEDHEIEHSIVQLIEEALPDFDKEFKFSERKQTYEKIRQMEQVHNSIMEILQPLKHVPTVMQDIVSQKEVVYRAINHGLVKKYLSHYHYSDIQNKIRILFERAEDLVQIKNEQFCIKLDELKCMIDENISNSKRIPSFHF
jgi:hypothetical protein